jgi:hypothetical protein
MSRFLNCHTVRKQLQRIISTVRRTLLHIVQTNGTVRMSDIMEIETLGTMGTILQLQFPSYQLFHANETIDLQLTWLQPAPSTPLC